MPVARWHVGKVVLFWVICAIAVVVAGSAATAVDEKAGAERARHADWRADERALQELANRAALPKDSIRHLLAQQLARDPDTLAAGIRARIEVLAAHRSAAPSRWFSMLQWFFAAAALVALLSPFVVTWRWFTAREVRKDAAA